MSHKKAKRLRAALSVTHLPESKLMINPKTKNIRRGWGARAAYQRMKGLDEEKQRLLISGLTVSA